MSSPSSQNQDLAEVHGFQHVLSDHVRTFVPFMRQDISMLRRAEEGLGESLSLPDFLSSRFNSKGAWDSLEFSSARSREKTPEAAPLSSLPSPPVSSPTSLSAAVDGSESFGAASSPRQSLERSQSPSTNSQKSFITSQLIVDEKDPTSPKTRHSPPTFASLSSPTGSQIDEMMVDPPTPTFDSLVAKATSAKKERNKSRSIPSPPSRPIYRRPSSSQDSSASSSNSSSKSGGSLESTGSHEFVAQQLTQSMDIDEDTNDHQYSSPGGSYRQNLPTMSILLGVTNERTPPMPIRRQEWYGTLPSRRSSLATPLDYGTESGLGSSTKLRASDSTPAQLSNTTSNAIPEHAFRSGTLQFSPPVDGRGTTSSQSSLTESQSSHESSLEYASYPLQTQAPYQSQSYSP